MYLPHCSVQDLLFSPYRSPFPVNTLSQHKFIPSPSNNPALHMKKSCCLPEWADLKLLIKRAVQPDELEAVEVFQTWQHSQFTTQTLYISLLSDLQPCSDMSHSPSPSLKPWTLLGPSQHMAPHRGVPREDLAPARKNPPLQHNKSAPLHPRPSTWLVQGVSSSEHKHCLTSAAWSACKSTGQEPKHSITLLIVQISYLSSTLS